MNLAQQDSDYRRQMKENQQQKRKLVMESYHDIAAGKGRDYSEFFEKLEKKYTIYEKPLS